MRRSRPPVPGPSCSRWNAIQGAVKIATIHRATDLRRRTNGDADGKQDDFTRAAPVKSLAKQLGPKGIRVNGVAPSPIWTPLQVSGGVSMEKLEKFGGQTPLGRPGQPAELGSIYVQLAADDASYANGQV
jgi:NAD(P)-dependent dehydrogenase (short-subunit alcohol dehydrogenase family)